MKRDRMMVFFLATGLVLGTSVRGVTTDGQGNPYQGVVMRNVFALKPPPDPAAVKPAEPELPKITPQGIMSMFGRQQVLFKTMMPGSKPGEPPRETAMVLSVGEREGEIEVVAIDESAGTITFNNHGKPQTLSLEKDGPKPPTGPAVAPFPGISVPGNPVVPPAAAAFNPSPSGSAVGAVAGSALRNIPIPTRTLRLPSATGSGMPAPALVIPGAAPTVTAGGGPALSAAPALGSGGSVPATAATTAAQTPQQKLTPEEIAALALISQEQHKHDPTWPPMPPIPGIDE